MKCPLCKNDITARIQRKISLYDNDEEVVLSKKIKSAVCKNCNTEYNTNQDNKVIFPGKKFDPPDEITVFRDGLMIHREDLKIFYSYKGEFSVLKKEGVIWDEKVRYLTSLEDMMVILEIIRNMLNILYYAENGFENALREMEEALKFESV